MTAAMKIKNLGCANCAAKMERKINALPGVKAARVNFLTQKLTLEAEEASMDSLCRQAAAIISSIEPDAVLLQKTR
ncbi:MAG: heavy-metal-associated domain-containing protein [Clostridiales bacterium]|jgi:copper chaperone CopZ|nr:heavy-metal-associated domain-containing protein [Clostridiales bacterium]